MTVGCHPPELSFESTVQSDIHKLPLHAPQRKSLVQCQPQPEMTSAVAACSGQRRRDCPQADPIQFIDLAVKSSRSSEQNRYLIRSHIAKNNRRKRTLLVAQRPKQTSLQQRAIVPKEPSLDNRGAVLRTAGDWRLLERIDAEQSHPVDSERASTYA